MGSAVRVVTRGSALALTQTRQLVELLGRKNPGCTFEIITLTTTGDRVTDRPLSQFRGMGVFVKELEKALLSGEADLAVHSLKDVPVERVEDLTLASFPLRKDPSDLLLTLDGSTVETLPQGAVIGTSSPRRLVQLRAKRPDLVFKDLRGNVDTRLRKLEEGNYTAIVAAAAGMLRLGRSFDMGAVLPLSVCLPAAGQGCLTIECRESDLNMAKIARSVDDACTRMEVSAERDFLRIIGGGCQTPVAVYAKCADGTLRITGVIGDPSLHSLARDEVLVPEGNSPDAGRLLAEKMILQCKEKNIRIV